MFYGRRKCKTDWFILHHKLRCFSDEKNKDHGEKSSIHVSWYIKSFPCIERSVWWSFLYSYRNHSLLGSQQHLCLTHKVKNKTKLQSKRSGGKTTSKFPFPFCLLPRYGIKNVRPEGIYEKEESFAHFQTFSAHKLQKGGCSCSRKTSLCKLCSPHQV